MKKFLAAVCASLILFSFVLFPQTKVHSQLRDNKHAYVDDQIVVQMKPGVEAGMDADLMAEEIVRVPGARAEVLSTRRQSAAQLIHLNRSVSVEEAVSRAKQDPRVEYAEPDYLVYAKDTIPNDTFFNQMWGLYREGCSICDPGTETPNIDATKAWDMTTGSDDVVAVVLDTGVDLEHEDLSSNKWVNPYPNVVPGFVDDINGWNFYNGNNRTFTSASEDFHGTHVAGSIGAVGNNGKGVTGVAWHVKIMSLKFLGGPQGKGATSNAVRGINYAIEMRNRGVNVRVINASWGGGNDSQALRQALAAANDAGILFVCAAGNESSNIDEEPDFPACYAKDLPNVISVAALDQVGLLASFSNFGHSSVSIAAPGVRIVSTYPGGSYQIFSGTSMSTPYVSGIAVLLWSSEPGLTPAQVRQRIVDTSEPIPSLVSIAARSGRASAYDALTNRIAPPKPPEVLNVQLTKRVVTINGFGFVNGSSIIEVDGTPLPTVSYDDSFALANGTLTQLTADIGKKPLKRAFPAGVQVSVVVVNQATGERSPAFSIARF